MKMRQFQPYFRGSTPICRPLSSACQQTPFFRQILHPMTPVSLQFTPNNPLFSKFQCKISIFLNAFRNLHQFPAKNGNFDSNQTQFTPNDPLYWEVHTNKSPILWLPHLMTTFFLQNPTPNTLYFHHLVGTHPSFSYSSTPPVLVLVLSIARTLRTSIGTNTSSVLIFRAPYPLYRE